MNNTTLRHQWASIDIYAHELVRKNSLHVEEIKEQKVLGQTGSKHTYLSEVVSW
jgi:hypothetical protein